VNTGKPRLQIGLRLFLLLSLLASILAAWVGLRQQLRQHPGPPVDYFGRCDPCFARYDVDGFVLVATGDRGSLSELPNTERLAILRLRQYDNGDLQRLPTFPSLQTIRFDDPDYQLTEEAVHHLAQCPALQKVQLLKATDDDLALLGGLEQITDLIIGSCRVTRVGLARLAEMQQLEVLSVNSMTVTQEQIDALQESLPNCIIVVQQIERTGIIR